MRIRQISIAKCGPLAGVDWQPGQIALVYDGNEEGKTALTDGLIHALFPAASFPGTERFADVEASVVVERAGEEMTFPRASAPRTAAQWLGWQEPQLARLLCIRSGELDLAARRDAFDRMRDALVDLFSGVGGKLEHIQARVRDAAHLTARHRWTDTQANPVQREVNEALATLARLEARLPDALALEAKERERAQSKERCASLDARIGALEAGVKRAEYRQQVRSYHAARELYRQWQALGERLNREYGRCREEDLAAWRAAEERRVLAQALVKDADALAAQDDAIGRQTAAVERAAQAAADAASAADRQRAAVDAEATRMRDQVTRLEMEQARSDAGSWKRLLGQAGASVFAVLAVLAVALGGSPAGWAGAAVCVLLAAACIGLALSGGGAERRLRKARAGLAEGIRELTGRTPGDDMAGTLAEWREGRLEEIRRPVAAADARRQDAGDRLHDLRVQREGLAATLRTRSDAMRHAGGRGVSPDDSAACRRDAGTILSAVDAEIGGLAARSGLADCEELAARLRERAGLDAERREVGVRLGQLLSVASAGDAPPVLQGLEQALAPEDRDPATLPQLPGEAELAVERARILDDLDGAHAEQKQEQQALDATQAEIEDLSELLLADGVRAPADVYTGIEKARAGLRTRVAERIAGVWAVQALQEVQDTYGDFLEEALRGGDSAAAGFLGRVTGRYTDVRYDRPAGLFTAVGQDGSEYPETALSEGTRKQLLLALRLAFLLRAAGPEPAFLILDDAFITFDDEGRKERAVLLLKDLVERGWQILYFTTDSTTRDLFAQHLGVAPLRVRGLRAPVQ